MNKYNKILFFVDIDDVLVLHKGPKACPQYPNPFNSFNDVEKSLWFYSNYFQKESILALKRLLEIDNTYIIIHSSWTRYLDLIDFKNIFFNYGIDQDRIIDCTSFKITNKNLAISQKMQDYPNTKYIVIDNDPITEHEEKQILIEEKLGLCECDVEKIKKIIRDDF